MTFVIPVDRLTISTAFDLKSDTTKVAHEEVFLRVTGGGGAASSVNVELCAEKPHSFENTEFDNLVIDTNDSIPHARAIGGINSHYGQPIFRKDDLTVMTELGDDSGDRGFGGILMVRRYSSREAYDGDGEVTLDGPGSTAEEAGIAAGYETSQTMKYDEQDIEAHFLIHTF